MQENWPSYVDLGAQENCNTQSLSSGRPGH